ncbi:hypothetical protein KEM56_006022 [Ascosphaera pollenicola]|nr:hypothetical protein KEM56_006022 [Ascosphaera pollenicola]
MSTLIPPVKRGAAFSDLTIECQGQRFPVHKVVMCPRSEVINAAIPRRSLVVKAAGKTTSDEEMRSVRYGNVKFHLSIARLADYLQIGDLCTSAKSRAQWQLSAHDRPSEFTAIVRLLFQDGNVCANFDEWVFNQTLSWSHRVFKAFLENDNYAALDIDLSFRAKVIDFYALKWDILRERDFENEEFRLGTRRRVGTKLRCPECNQPNDKMAIARKDDGIVEIRCLRCDLILEVYETAAAARMRESEERREAKAKTAVRFEIGFSEYFEQNIIFGDYNEWITGQILNMSEAVFGNFAKHDNHTAFKIHRSLSNTLMDG